MHDKSIFDGYGLYDSTRPERESQFSVHAFK